MSDKFTLKDVAGIAVAGFVLVGAVSLASSCIKNEDQKIKERDTYKTQVYDWYQYEATEEQQAEACADFRLRWDRNEGWNAVGDWYEETRDVPEDMGWTHARAISRMCNS